MLNFQNIDRNFAIEQLRELLFHWCEETENTRTARIVPFTFTAIYDLHIFSNLIWTNI